MKQKEKQEDMRNLYKEWKNIGHVQMICTLLYKKLLHCKTFKQEERTRNRFCPGKAALNVKRYNI